jgi:hypothetical protein
MVLCVISKVFCFFCHSGLLCYRISLGLSHYIVFFYVMSLVKFTNQSNDGTKRSKGTYKEEDVRPWYFFKSSVCIGGLMNTCI